MKKFLTEQEGTILETIMIVCILGAISYIFWANQYAPSLAKAGANLYTSIVQGVI